MVSSSANDLSAFHEFVAGQISSNSDLNSPEDCLVMWRTMHPNPKEFSGCVEILKSSIQDMEAGDRGRSARQLLSESRQNVTRIS
jgi:hypothetical protein